MICGKNRRLQGFTVWDDLFRCRTVAIPERVRNTIGTFVEKLM